MVYLFPTEWLFDWLNEWMSDGKRLSFFFSDAETRYLTYLPARTSRGILLQNQSLQIEKTKIRKMLIFCGTLSGDNQNYHYYQRRGRATWWSEGKFFSYAKYSKLWMLQRVLQSVKINLIMIFFSLPFSCCPKYKRTAPYPCCYSTGTGNIFINENLFIERQIKKKWYFSVCECLISTSCESSSMWS